MDGNLLSGSGNKLGAPLGKPVWRHLVGNKAFEENNREAVRADARAAEQAQREAVRAAAAAEREKPPIDRWGGENGRLLHQIGNTIEEHDPETLADDPVAGPFARKTLFDRELKTAKQDEGDWKFKADNPEWKASILSDKDYEQAV